MADWHAQAGFFHDVAPSWTLRCFWFLPSSGSLGSKLVPLYATQIFGNMGRCQGCHNDSDLESCSCCESNVCKTCYEEGGSCPKCDTDGCVMCVDDWEECSECLQRLCQTCSGSPCGVCDRGTICVSCAVKCQKCGRCVHAECMRDGACKTCNDD